MLCYDLGLPYVTPAPVFDRGGVRLGMPGLSPGSFRCGSAGPVISDNPPCRLYKVPYIPNMNLLQCEYGNAHGRYTSIMRPGHLSRIRSGLPASFMTANSTFPKVQRGSQKPSSSYVYILLRRAITLFCLVTITCVSPPPTDRFIVPCERLWRLVQSKV